MLTTVNDTIAFNLKASAARLHQYIDDLKPQEFEHQPFPGVNSVAWILGHLAMTDRRILGLFNVEGPAIPEGFADRFKQTRTAATEQKGLGEPKELVAIFDAYRSKLIETVLSASMEALNKPLPTPLGPATTVGEAATFMSVHVSLHAGQITLIRRSLGYPPVS